MFEDELPKLRSKYRLWKVLHPGMDYPEIGCYLCCMKRGKREKDIEFGKACPDVRILANPGVKGGLRVARITNVGWRDDCVEWVRYV